jgi:hypothetical protein
MKEDTLKRIEREAEKHSPVPTGISLLPIDQQKQAGYEAGLVCGGFVAGAKSERNTTIDEVIEILRKGRFVTDDAYETTISDLNKMKL